MKKDLISLKNLSPEDITYIMDLTSKVKYDSSYGRSLLEGQSVGLVFQKPSNRTRVSFEVGITQLGGHCLYLGPDDISLGVRESTEDVAKTLSRYLNAIVARTYAQEDIEELAKHATIPIINGLSDLYHPCQALTDIFSIKEHFQTLENKTIAYVGDGNNVCHSLMIGCAKLGLHMNIATPKGYAPADNIVHIVDEIAQTSGARILIMQSPEEAVKNVDVIYADVWVSMGQEEETKKRLKHFKDFQINSALTKLASQDYIFMHCLPAHRGEEVTANVIDGPHSIVFDQAENRLHTQKAILLYLMAEHKGVTS